LLLQIIFVSSLPNSEITWRHMPQGNVYCSLSLVTAMAAISVLPSETAFTTAVRSAQMVAPKEEFSTLQPVYILPSAVSTAAPTRKPE